MAYCYILKLDTYYEERTACWKESKLTNGPILGPDQGVPPAQAVRSSKYVSNLRM